MAELLNESVTIKTLLSIIFGGIIALLLITLLFFRYLRKQRNNLHVRPAEMGNLPNKNQVEKFSTAEIDLWFKNSSKALENKNYSSSHDYEIIQEEIRKREKLIEDFSTSPDGFSITIENLEGTYSIIGLNQNKEQSTYNGFLHLVSSGNKRVVAEWVIGGIQTQNGIGFYNGNTLVINFSYAGEDENEGKTFKGIVVYKLLSSSILSGFWSEKHGNDDYIGFEEGRKLEEHETISYQAQMN